MGGDWEKEVRVEDGVEEEEVEWVGDRGWDEEEEKVGWVENRRRGGGEVACNKQQEGTLSKD